MRNPKVDRDLFPCAGRASLALGGNSRSVLGVQMVPKWLWARRGSECMAEVQSWWNTSHTEPFLLERGAGVQGGLPRRHHACSGCWLHCTYPRSTLPCSHLPPFSSRNIQVARIHKEQLNRVAHPLHSCKIALLVVTVSYSTNGHHQHSTHLQQVALIKPLQKKRKA